jgi:hypothetical protein
LEKGGKGGFSNDKEISNAPLLYYKTKEEIGVLIGESL